MKQHFDEYNDLEARIKELQFKLTVVENQLYSVRGVSYDAMPKGNTYGDARLYMISEKDDIVEEISELKKQKQKLYQKHVEEIALIQDSRHRSILRSCYLHKMKNQDVADMLGLSLRRFKEIKREAIENFKEIALKSPE